MQLLMEKPRTGARKYTTAPQVNELIYGLLLAGDVDYERVAKRVRTIMPEAQTTVKSVAATATRLRREGYEVPYRQPKILGQ